MFESLENTLLEIKSELRLYRELFALQLDSLRTRKQVAKFLQVDPKTVHNYTLNGTFKEGVHFVVHESGKKEYVPEAIIQFKKEMKNRKKEVKKVEKQLNPIASKFLNNRRVLNG